MDIVFLSRSKVSVAINYHIGVNVCRVKTHVDGFCKSIATEIFVTTLIRDINRHNTDGRSTFYDG